MVQKRNLALSPLRIKIKLPCIAKHKTASMVAATPTPTASTELANILATEYRTNTEGASLLIQDDWDADQADTR